MLVFTGLPTLVCPCKGVHGSMLLMSSSFLHQHCPACLVCLSWMVYEMGKGKWAVLLDALLSVFV